MRLGFEHQTVLLSLSWLNAHHLLSTNEDHVCIKNMTCIWHLQLYPRHHTTGKLRTLCSLACTCMLQTYLCHGHQASLRLTIMACTEMCSRTEQEVECGELLYPFWYPQDMKVFSLLVSSLKSRLWGRVGCVCTLLFHAALVPFTISGLNSYRALPLLFILHAIKSGGGQELSLFFILQGINSLIRRPPPFYLPFAFIIRV